MKWTKALWVMVLVLALGAFAAACGTGSDTAQAPAGEQSGENGQQGEQAQEKKTIRVGTDAAYPPFEWQGPDGKIEGFDMEIIRAIAEANGWELEIRHTGWDGLFEELKNGTVDLGISSISITEERKQKYDFSEPYLDIHQLIIVPQDADVKEVKDLQGMKIGVQAATTGQFLVEKALGKGYEGLRQYDDTPSAVEDLFNKRVDAVVADFPVLVNYLKEHGKEGYKLVKDPNAEPEQYGIMVRKGNAELLAKINEGLKTIKENGKYDEIYNKYKEYFELTDQAK
ncbi:basic amino acid ABC transporter substrate-binding protein [Bacillaceae bacterium]